MNVIIDVRMFLDLFQCEVDAVLRLDDFQQGTGEGGDTVYGQLAVVWERIYLVPYTTRETRSTYPPASCLKI